MKSRILILLAAVAVLVWGISAAVDARPRRGARRGGARMEAPMKALDLTDAQQEKMKALRLAHAKEMAQLRADQKVARLELRELLGQDDPDATKVKARVAGVNKVRGEIMQKNVDLRLGINKTLTPEQRKKLKDLRGMRMGRGPSKGMRGKGGHFMGRRGGQWGGCGPGGFCVPQAAPPVPQE